jgi:hypothetical protein
MTTRDDVHRKAGEALGLAQALELALTVPIMMLFLLESGHGKDLSKRDLLALIKEDKARERPTVKVTVVDDSFRQRMRLEISDIQMLVRNGSMGALKQRLQKYLRVSPGGPPAPLDVLQVALEARNYLCHEFFKDFGTNLEQDQGADRAASKLDNFQDAIREAITFCDQLTKALRQQFPRTFDETAAQIH